jgi:6-hydroxycyclohex-1-ene-1-carbonyl-CoA dehydrogenase
LVEPGQPLRRSQLEGAELGADEVVVEVAGCGVCHTDIGFAYDGVPTRHPLPLILGHEISGVVIGTGEGAVDWQGKRVIVPAVIPCGECPACAAGKSAICRHQFMPGNDGDGGFATHVRVPSRGLCPVPDSLPEGVSLADLSVVASLKTTSPSSSASEGSEDSASRSPPPSERPWSPSTSTRSGSSWLRATALPWSSTRAAPLPRS